ncbi:hypothetical protein IOC51_06850 [Vibrio parahaemolyticus]|uniref:hypothetical protein n=1 Tax=Vibrio parahaemolyticus TaxID=670 RepID=UPI001E4A2627|nr:hypothetical protein [Vibrio parahaemolyticus]MCD1413754.1 hypothetical protein [Vibrio parahaemolyticus]
MKISKQAFEDARVELSALGFKAALNQLQRKTGWDEDTAIRYLSKQTANIEEVFIQAKKRGVKSYLVDKLIKALAAKGVVFYKHQLYPPKLIIENHALEKIYKASNV